MQTFFILGNPRSGTSLLRLMLNAHPLIVVPPESGFLQWWHSQYGGWDQSSNDQARVRKFIADLRTSKKIETWNLNFDQLAREIIEKRPASYGELMALVYLSFAQLKNKSVRLIGDKNNYYINHVPELKTIWPASQFILIVRDGRDVACSYLAIKNLRSDSPYKPQLSQNIEEIAHEWLANNERVLNSFSNQPGLMVVRYEDLVCQSEAVLRRICEFLQIAYDGKMLEYHISNKLNKDEPPVTLDWKLKTLEKPDPGNVGKYHDILSPGEISKFNAIAAPMLRRFNYPL